MYLLIDVDTTFTLVKTYDVVLAANVSYSIFAFGNDPFRFATLF